MMNDLIRAMRLDDARAIVGLLLATAPCECSAGLVAVLRLLDAAEGVEFGSPAATETP